MSYAAMETGHLTERAKTVHGRSGRRTTASTWKHNRKHWDTGDSHTDVLYKWMELLFYKEENKCFMSSCANYRLQLQSYLKQPITGTLKPSLVAGFPIHSLNANPISSAHKQSSFSWQSQNTPRVAHHVITLVSLCCGACSNQPSLS